MKCVMDRDQDDIDEIEMEDHHGSSEAAWIPLILTHVEYVRGDWVGLFFALSSLGPMTLIISFITLILFRRDLHTMVFFAGYLIMEPLNYFLKLKIRESRPLKRENHLGDYGMPSAHAQHLWFFATYSILFILIRLERGSSLENCGLIVILVVSAALITYGRVYLQYHTWTQVALGGLLGAIAGALWFTFVHLVLTPVFPAIVSWKISEFLLIRDTSNIPDLMNFEYKTAVQENQRLSNGKDENLLQTSTSCLGDL